MSLIEGIGRMAIDVGIVLLNASQSAAAGQAGRHGEGPAGRVSWPLPGATAEHKNRDGNSTMYAPTSLALDTSAAIEDNCPMQYSVGETGNFINLGAGNAGMALTFTDQSLLDFTKITMRASREMLRNSGQPAPDWLGYELR
jgi:hypothetical protein